MPTTIQQQIASYFEAYPLHTFEARTFLINPDEPLPGVFYLVEGRVSQYDITPSGNEVVVNAFKPGAFFPMSTALNGTPNPYYFEASTAVKAHVAPPEDAVRFLKDNPEVALDLLSRVYRGVDGVLRRMAHLMGGDAKTRLLFELLNAAHRFGETHDDASVFVPLTESDIARHSGLARETVNRHMHMLKASGIITVTRSGVTIIDPKQLKRLLGNDI